MDVIIMLLWSKISIFGERNQHETEYLQEYLLFLNVGLADSLTLTVPNLIVAPQ